MRVVRVAEMKKRGCIFCADHQSKKYRGRKQKVCIHNECPYHELDKYEKYRDYLKHEAPILSLTKVLGLKKKGG